MIATHAAELLLRLRKGVLDPIDTAMLEQTPADHLVAELRSSLYRLTFQERRIGDKWEISLAHSFRAELAIRPIPEAVFVSFLLVPAYLNCLMLNIENNHLTGISRLSRLTVWAVSDPERGLALRSGHGFKLDKTLDGWNIKPMRKRVVKLSGEFLRERGWRFDHLKQFIPVP
jgi:hypothetical protein